MKKNKLKLAIVGYGFVGKATDFGFDRNVDKYIVDPKLGTEIKELSEFNPDIIFICVPTPMGSDGNQDSSIIMDVIKKLARYCPSSVKVVKSTVLPSVLEEVSKIEEKLIYNPEFLREKHANEDFVNANIIILGGNKDEVELVSKAYKNNSKCKTHDHYITDVKTASFIKYSINTFLASKVVFFNELHSVYEKMDAKDNWESVIEVLSKDVRIGKSHMQVPGHDGKKGFGGACFPKDSIAFAMFAENLGIDMTALKNSIKTNNKIRSTYDTIEVRESEQSITFDDKI